MAYERKYLTQGECNERNLHSRNGWKELRYSVPHGVVPVGTLWKPQYSQRIPMFSPEQVLPMKPKRGGRVADPATLLLKPPVLSAEDNAILAELQL